jgi:uncharacterized protein YdbL (DUF1318 family)
MQTTSLMAVLLLAMAPVCQQAEPAQERPRDAGQQDPRDALKQRMAGRYPALERLRDAGKVGETFGGFAEAVKPEFAQEKVDPKDAKSETVGQVVAAENADRRQLYDLLAKELKLSAEQVGRQNAIRLLEKARPDHWFKLQDGRWVQRKLVNKDAKIIEDAPARGR